MLLVGLVALTIGLAIALLRGGREPPRSAPAPAPAPAPGTAGIPVTSVLANAADAARVEITGATADEQRIAREALAQAGPNPAIERIRFDGPPGRRRLLIDQPTEDVRLRWLAEVVAQNVIARLGTAGDRIVEYGFADRPLEHVTGARPTAGGPSLADAVDRARASLARAGADAELTTYPIGAVAVTWRLDEAAMLGAAQMPWLRAATAETRGPEAYYTEVEAPDGSPIFRSGDGIGTCYACGAASETAIPGTPTGDDALRRTTLDIRADPGRLGGRPRRVRVDCTNIVTDPTVAALCRDVDLDRYALLQPLVAGPGCVGGIASPQITVRGTFAGRPIDRAYGTCEEAAGARWIALLRRHGLVPEKRSTATP